jgi:hypothetical protein
VNAAKTAKVSKVFLRFIFIWFYILPVLISFRLTGLFMVVVVSNFEGLLWEIPLIQVEKREGVY